ncbi:hypothetical protein ACFFMR_32765 [Micromonospora andamanensis]|uniref:Zinc ribbon domain-containing protein n=1 Tax=Micromonospora andamanensis TaxID=1287068 RepID=A0ABQ4I2Q0_9ACTN|nr:hypothetical protein [Micromonospora andamanensis]GIJ12189.1 hypothetical protein Van01_54030 [Micromonospora andamanensis]
MWDVTGGSWDGFAKFRMAQGASIVGRDGDSFEVRVSIPSDEHGFFGRQCPSCRQIFRVDGDDYEALPDDLELWCVYCGHHEDHSEFMTQQQLDRAMRAAGDLGMQIVGQALDDAFSRFRSPRRRSSRSRSGFSIRIQYRSKPFYPEPLPAIDEEKLIRVRNCAGCSLRYAVFGEHRFCPVCGTLPAMVVALDALSAETARLDGLEELPAETAASLREQGVFTRLWVDTLKNLVGIVEALGSAVFRDAVVDAQQRLNGKGNVFQRLADTADLFVAAGYPDLRTVLEPDRWERLIEFWAMRHVFTHNDGLVDAKFLTKVPASTARFGQRLTLTERQCRQAITDAEALCHALTALTIP